MPEISRFFGISICMYYDDHAPPHFHAWYAGDQAEIEIQRLGVISGSLPPKALGLVMEWAALHQDELMVDWANTSRNTKPNKIAPLA